MIYTAELVQNRLKLYKKGRGKLGWQLQEVLAKSYDVET